MGRLDILDTAQRAAFDQWLANVLHDLVKYLELMPRNLDWDALEEDDADLLYEAIFETRVDRNGARSAKTLWAQAREKLPPSLSDLPSWVDVDDHIDELEGSRAVLESGNLEALDITALKNSIFGVGEVLRALRA